MCRCLFPPRGFGRVFLALVLAGCSGADDGHSEIEEYGRTLSPDGDVSAYVYHYDSPTGGLTQVVLDFVGLSIGCGFGSASWQDYDIGVELHWVDSRTLEVTYPDGKSYRHNASGDFLGCQGHNIRVVMAPRRNANPTSGEYSKPVESDRLPSPDHSIRAYTFRYDSPQGGIAQVVVDFPETNGCADSAVTFYAADTDLQLQWIDSGTLEVRYPDGQRYDYPPWGTTIRCVTRTVQLKMQPAA